MNTMTEEAKKTNNTGNKEDVMRWLQAYKSTTDEATKSRMRNLIVMSYMPLVKKISHGIARRNTDPIEDLIQVGFLGLIRAMDMFDFEVGKNFRAYATYLITGEIRHYIRDKAFMIKAPREIQELAFRVNQIALQISQEYGENPTDEQLAKILQMPLRKVNQVYELERRKQTVSLDQMIAFVEDDAAPLSERISDEDEHSSTDFQENKIMIQAALNRLNPKIKRVIELNFYEDLTQKEIADALNLTQMQVSRLLKKGLNDLFKIINGQRKAKSITRSRRRRVKH